MTEPPRFDYVAHLADFVPDLIDVGPPWYITHPLGRPAGGTYTEVAFSRTARFAAARHERPDAVLEEVVRRVAVDLYGTAWAFTYRPDQYDDAIGRWQMRRRERVVVTVLNLYTDREDRP